MNINAILVCAIAGLVGYEVLFDKPEPPPVLPVKVAARATPEPTPARSWMFASNGALGGSKIQSTVADGAPAPYSRQSYVRGSARYTGSTYVVVQGSSGGGGGRVGYVSGAKTSGGGKYSAKPSAKGEGK